MMGVFEPPNVTPQTLTTHYTSDPLTMIKCEPFCGKPASGVAGCQPFEMKMQSNVLVAMDFHAHLMTTEIIGFLAGKWDKEKKRKSELKSEKPDDGPNVAWLR